jgi:2'-5' RNA ligase
VRLFVAIRPPAHVVEVLGALRRAPVAGVTWSVPEQWVVKLRPLGHVADHVVDPLVTALADELEGVPPQRAEDLDDVGGRPDGHEQSHRVGLVPVTHPQPFQADVVLARGRVPAAAAGEPVAAEWTAREVALVADRSSPRRPLLDDVATFRLSG